VAALSGVESESSWVLCRLDAFNRILVNQTTLGCRSTGAALRPRVQGLAFRSGCAADPRKCSACATLPRAAFLTPS
jgi:hypothetical protein